MKDMRLVANPRWIWHADFSADGGQKVAAEYLQSVSRPTSIVFSTDIQAAAFASAVSSTVKLPDDLSIVSYDGTYLCDVSRPKLCTIRQSTAELARQAVGQLIRLVGGEEPVKTLLEVDTLFVSGDSVSPPQVSSE